MNPKGDTKMKEEKRQILMLENSNVYVGYRVENGE
jgi:hypothetical protein